MNDNEVQGQTATLDTHTQDWTNHSAHRQPVNSTLCIQRLVLQVCQPHSLGLYHTTCPCVEDWSSRRIYHATCPRVQDWSSRRIYHATCPRVEDWSSRRIYHAMCPCVVCRGLVQPADLPCHVSMCRGMVQLADTAVLSTGHTTWR